MTAGQIGLILYVVYVSLKTRTVVETYKMFNKLIETNSKLK